MNNTLLFERLVINYDSNDTATGNSIYKLVPSNYPLITTSFDLQLLLGICLCHSKNYTSHTHTSYVHKTIKRYFEIN